MDYYLKRIGAQWTVGEMKYDAQGRRHPGPPIKRFKTYEKAAAYYDTLPKSRPITRLIKPCSYRFRGVLIEH